MGIIRHADAGYEKAIEFVEKNGVKVPMANAKKDGSKPA
jgi:urocanate hydratase